MQVRATLLRPKTILDGAIGRRVYRNQGVCVRVCVCISRADRCVSLTCTIMAVINQKERFITLGDPSDKNLCSLFKAVALR